jgi:hypothetical protein
VASYINGRAQTAIIREKDDLHNLGLRGRVRQDVEERSFTICTRVAVTIILRAILTKLGTEVWDQLVRGAPVNTVFFQLFSN